MDGDVTVGILREIRDEIRSTRVELRAELQDVRQELQGVKDELSARIDLTNARLGKLEGAMLDMAGQQRFVVRYLKVLGTRDHKLETDVVELQGRVEVLEERTKR